MSRNLNLPAYITDPSGSRRRRRARTKSLSSQKPDASRRAIHVPEEMSLIKAVRKAKRSNGQLALIILNAGNHTCKTSRSSPLPTLVVDFPLTITGKGEGKTVIIGQIIIEGNKRLKERINFERLTITNPDGGCGIWNDGGLPIILESVEVTNCNAVGIYLAFGARATITDCHIHRNQTGLIANGAGTIANLYDVRIHHNKHSGIWASHGSLANLYGEEVTSIHHNSLSSNNAYGIVAQHWGTRVCLYMESSCSNDNTKDRNEKEKDHGKIAMVDPSEENTNNRNLINDDESTKLMLRVPQDASTLRECLVLAKEKDAQIISLSEGWHGNLQPGEDDENGTNGGPPLLIDFPIKIEGKGQQKTTIAFGIVIDGENSGGKKTNVHFVELENLTLTNTKGTGIEGNNGYLHIMLDTVEIHSCDDDGVRVTKGTMLTYTEGHIHHNGGSGVVIGEDHLKKKKWDKNQGKMLIHTEDEFYRLEHGGNGDTHHGGGSKNNDDGENDKEKKEEEQGKKEEKDEWGDFDGDGKKSNFNVSSGELTDLHISCNNKSGLKVGDGASVNLFGEATEIMHNAKKNIQDAGILVGEHSTCKIFLPPSHSTTHLNMGGGNRKSRVGGVILNTCFKS